MDFLTKLSGFGNFSVKDNQREIIIKQNNYFLIVFSFMLFLLFLFFIPLMVHFAENGHFTRRGRHIYIIILCLIGCFVSIKEMFSYIQKQKVLKIDRIKKVVIYKEKELSVERIHFVALGSKINNFYLNSYCLLFYIYPNIKQGKKQILLRSSFFVPTPLSKNLMTYLANEINKMTSAQEFVNNKIRFSDVLKVIKLMISAIFIGGIVFFLFLIY